MIRFKYLIAIVLLTFVFSSFKPEWGFFGHRLINKISVFTLPTDMIPFYKKNIDYLEEHAVDPDKRRYATKHEGARHYIDIDVWGEYPFENVPRDLDMALMKFSHYYHIKNQDTTRLKLEVSKDSFQLSSEDKIFAEGNIHLFRKNFDHFIMPQYYDEMWTMPFDSLDTTLRKQDLSGTMLVEDHFSNEGILPYHLETMKWKLTKAFENQDSERILRLSAEIGHYIGDAHVPLHTTVNYNGQLTDQVGIHGFWESRIPELFALSQYNFMVGKAEYILDTKSYFWGVVLESHSRLADVLRIEKELSKKFPEDQQYCYDDRLDVTIRTYCPEYAAAYQNALQGMVEERMTDAIKSIGSVWYTCWVDAGQPDLNNLQKIESVPEEIIQDENVRSTARSHE